MPASGFRDCASPGCQWPRATHARLMQALAPLAAAAHQLWTSWSWTSAAAPCFALALLRGACGCICGCGWGLLIGSWLPQLSRGPCGRLFYALLKAALAAADQPAAHSGGLHPSRQRRPVSLPAADA